MSSRSTSQQALWHDCFTQSQRQLLQLLTHYTGNAEDARDLAQDLWLRLPPADAHAENPRAYLFGMARNMALDHLRRRGREQECANALHVIHDQAASEPDHAKRHLQQSLLEDIERALDALPRRMRDVFVRHQIHGETLRAIAAHHRVAPATVVRDLDRAQACIDAVVERWSARDDAVPPAEAEAEAGDKALQRQQRRRFLLSSLLGATGLAGSGTLAWQLWRHLIPQHQYVLASHTGQRLAPHALPDGSTLTLDAASRAAIRYYARRRTVALQQGAAYFDVLRDAQRPFTVSAQGVQVRVLGTRFSIDLQPAGTAATGLAAADASTAALHLPAVEIAVTSGLVRVEAVERSADAKAHWRFEPLELTAGQRIRLYAAATQHTTSRIEPLPSPDAAGDADWRHGRLDFHNAPLGRIVSRLQRYSQQPLRLDPRAAHLPVTARIHTDEAEQWLRLLPRILPVQVSTRAGGLDIVAR